MLRRAMFQPSISSFKITTAPTAASSNPILINNFCFVSAAGSHAKFKQSAWSGSDGNNNNNNTTDQQQQSANTNSTSSGGSCGSGGCGGCGGGQQQRGANNNSGSKPNSDNGTVFDDHARYLGFRNALANMSRGMLYFVFVAEFMWPTVLLK